MGEGGRKCLDKRRFMNNENTTLPTLPKNHFTLLRILPLNSVTLFAEKPFYVVNVLLWYLFVYDISFLFLSFSFLFFPFHFFPFLSFSFLSFFQNTKRAR